MLVLRSPSAMADSIKRRTKLMNVDVMDGENCLARANSSVTLNKVHAMYGSVVVHGMGVESCYVKRHGHRRTSHPMA